MKNRIFPNWEQLNSLKVPLTDGERALAKFFDEKLPLAWEIYIQPYFNGDRPDIVLLNPNVGMMIYEVKDWNLSLYRTEKDGTDNYKSYVIDKNGNSQYIVNPIKQVERYRTNLLRYIPKIANEVDDDKNSFGVFRVGLYFHNATTEQVKNFVPNTKHCTVMGGMNLLNSDIKETMPDIGRSGSKYMNSDWADDIRFWLHPPYHSLEQNRNFDLSTEQKRHVNPSPQQHQRLRGVAGSGKTLVIAQRASNLASEGKKVLIVSFNITLWHYIKDAISRTKNGFDWSKLEFNHFHGFCRNFLMENNIEVPENNNDEDYFDVILPNLVMDTINKGKNSKNRVYDAILIDEGQDYEQSYYDVLCKFLSDNNELLFVIDEKQNIYDRELSWIDKMQGTKFRGRWRELNKSYRLPLIILKEANKFSKMFLPEIGLIAEPIKKQSIMELSDGRLINPRLSWSNIDKSEDFVMRIYNTFEKLTKQESIHPSEIVILVGTHKEGMQLVNKFESNNIRVNHIFEDDNKDTYRNKHSFWMGDSRLKISTIHSFKGWELLNVIVLTPMENIKQDIDALMYISITRARENLIVFNRIDRYVEYGVSWNSSF